MGRTARSFIQWRCHAVGVTCIILATNSDFDISRCGIRDKRLNRAIGNRIQVFQQFVRLFEVEA